jgi:uncharacterized protein
LTTDAPVPTPSQPLPQALSLGDRLDVLDALRGVAVLGILLFNIAAFSGYEFLSPKRARMLHWSASDPVAASAIEVFVHGKFYSLFSLLFGVGFAVFMRRAESRGAEAAPLFRRRLVGLMMIGICHSVLIWYGDILTLYALLGFCLIPFWRRSDATVLRWSLGMLALPIALYGLALATLAVTVGGAGGSPSSRGEVPRFLADALDGFASSSYLAILKGNVVITGAGWLRRLLYLTPPKIFGMFLLGLYAGRCGLFEQVEARRSMFRTASRWGLAVGLPSSIAVAGLVGSELPRLPSLAGWIRTILESIGTPALSLGYASVLTLLFQHQKSRTRLMHLAYVGRMALSNYLLHSVAAVLIFYGIGLGLFRGVSLTVALVMALGFFVLQVLLSRWWLQRATFGPVEWLWRQFTYRQRFPLWRRVPAGGS